MYFRNKKPLQTVALVLVICLANTFGFAVTPNDSLLPDGDVLFTGILTAFDAQSVKVNGNVAQDGMTILSGDEIVTNKNSGVIINLAKLGKVELNSSTSVKLVFMAGYIELQVLSGQAKLTTYQGISGILIDTDGKISKTNSSLEVSSIRTVDPVTPSVQLVIPPQNDTPPRQSGVWSTLMSVGGMLGGAISAWNMLSNSNNASLSPVSNVQP